MTRCLSVTRMSLHDWTVSAILMQRSSERDRYEAMVAKDAEIASLRDQVTTFMYVLLEAWEQIRSLRQQLVSDYRKETGWTGVTSAIRN